MKFLRDNRFFLALFIPFIIIPWIKIGNNHLLIFNFPHNRFEYFGLAIEMGTYSLILLLTVIVIAIALLSGQSLSRFYCGSYCPNTFFAHLLTLFKAKKQSILVKMMGLTFLTVLAITFSFSIIAYGIDSNELLDALFHLNFTGWLVVVLSALMITEVYMLQGWYCAYLCPYGAICAILPLEDRLTYQYEDTNKQCVDCQGCVKVCPIPDLDIRKGFDIRCIQCGLCETACEKIFAKTDIQSLIVSEKRSHFKAAGRGKGIVIAIILITVVTIASIFYLVDEQELNSCRLENRFLYIK